MGRLFVGVALGQADAWKLAVVGCVWPTLCLNGERLELVRGIATVIDLYTCFRRSQCHPNARNPSQRQGVAQGQAGIRQAEIMVKMIVSHVHLPWGSKVHWCASDVRDIACWVIVYGARQKAIGGNLKVMT